MPVIYQKETQGGWLLLWRITETEEELSVSATPQERERASGISNLTRRCEWLAWRAALRSRIPDAVIGYDAAGGPVLVGGSGYIGVSHTVGLAAVIWNPKTPCALDVERLGRNFDRVVPKYLAPEEEALSGGDPRFRAVGWCVKETLYKYARVKGADMLRDLRILHYDPVADESCDAKGSEDCAGDYPVSPEGRLRGLVPGDSGVELRFFTLGEYVTVYTSGVFFV